VSVENAMLPAVYSVARRRRETADTWTLELEPRDVRLEDPVSGQFTMLYAWGVGEVPISVSDVGGGGRLAQTVRDVGAVTRALCALEPGRSLGVRGPLGRGWPLAELRGRDVVVVAGGLGMAPLRSAVRTLVERREEYGRLLLLYGARTPGDLLYGDELERWSREGLDVQLTVDAAGAGWEGRVGVVGKLVARADFDPAEAAALVCGPEVMMRFTAMALAERGVAAERTYVSLERAMKCGVGHCGHCQLGPTLVCLDGPVYSWGEVAPLLAVRGL
jgi:anaerobic sulfite reductase subunit B